MENIDYRKYDLTIDYKAVVQEWRDSCLKEFSFLDESMSDEEIQKQVHDFLEKQPKTEEDIELEKELEKFNNSFLR